MAAKDNTQDGIELQEQPAHGAAASAASPGLTERLIDIGHVDDVADVEKGVPVGADTNVVSHLRTPSPQEDAVEAPVKNKSKSKKPAFLAAFNRESRSATIIFALMVVVAMSLAGVVAMAIVSSKGKSSLYPPAKPSNISLTECGADNQVIKELQEALGTTAAGVVHMAAVAATTAAATTIELRDGGYLQGVSGVLGDPSSLVQHAREAGAPDFFDAEATAFSMSTLFFNVTLSSTSGTSANLNGSVMPMTTSVKDSPHVPTVVVPAAGLTPSEGFVVIPWLTMSNIKPETSTHLATAFMTQSTLLIASDVAKLTESAMVPEASTTSVFINTPFTESTAMAEANISTTLFSSPWTFSSTSASASITEMPSSASTAINAPTSSASSMSSQSCGEVGDGAGPCARPYGSPNTTPASVLSIQSDKIATTTAGTADLASACPAPSTVTVTSSLTSVQPTGNSSPVHRSNSTVFGSATLLWHVTKTAISTATESVRWVNGTQVVASNNGSTAVPSNMTSTAGASSATSTTAAVLSGGELSAPKPLGASGSDSGVYCTVILVALLALLL